MTLGPLPLPLHPLTALMTTLLLTTPRAKCTKVQQRKDSSSVTEAGNQQSQSASQRESTGLTGDQAESNGATSSRPNLTVSFSHATCHARLSVIATKNAYLAFLAIFWEVTKAVGLTGDQAKSKRASSSRPELPVTFLLLVSRATETIATKDTHIAFLAICTPCCAPCSGTSPAFLLPLPACCHLLPLPATSAAVVCFAKIRPEVARVWRPSWGGF